MHAVVVAGSRLEAALDQDVLDAADVLVAADGGADALMAVGRRPHVLVGDMDSIDAAVLAELEAGGVEVMRLPVEKDETDLERALRVAVERGADRVTVVGALGGPRLDHLVGTLLMLTAPWLLGRDVRLLDRWHEVYLAHGDAVVRGAKGDTVSLLPLSETVADVRTEGLVYRLEGESLRQAGTRGVSNAMAGDEARVRHGEGLLLIIHYRGANGPSVRFSDDERGGLGL